MNYLMHAMLAGDDAADRVGGIIGDFVKGTLPGPLSPRLAEGVRLHRAIDSFADRHPAFQRSRSRVSVERRRVSGIMVDLFYDHFLARHWSSLSATALSVVSLFEFTAAVYRDIEACNLAILPAGSLQVLARMKDEDWLAAYADPTAVGRALDRMALYRLRQPNPLGGAGEELRKAYAGFKQDCFEFVQDAAAFAADHRARRSAIFAI